MLRTLAFAAAVLAALAAPTLSQENQMPPLPAPNTSGYVPVAKGEVYYTTYGQGDPLVLLHGGFGQIEMFGPLLGQLAEKHTLIGVDLQGHGRTLPFDRPMSFEAMASDVATVIRHLGYEKADVLGFSMGGGVAAHVAALHPEVVNRLILMSAPPSTASMHDYNIQGMAGIAAAPEQAAEGMKQSPMYEYYAQVAPDVNNWGKLVAQMGAFITGANDWYERVSSITAPTLLVYGDWDAIRTSHVARLFELLGGGTQDAQWDRSGMNSNRLAVIPNATHYDILYSPLLLPVIEGFLAE